MLGIFLGTMLSLASLFLILLVLIQQGKGGGLSAAFGGGGNTAFGTKAGDVFTRVTIVTALVWIFLCMLTIKLQSRPTTTLGKDLPMAKPPAANTAPLTPGGITLPGDPAAPAKTDASKTDAPKTDSTPAPIVPAPVAPAPETPAPVTPSPSTPAPATTPAPETPAPTAK